MLETHKYLPFIRTYVHKIEISQYRKSYPGVQFIECPDEIRGNIARVRNFILRREFKDAVDVVVMVDDDMRGVCYWEGNVEHLVLPRDFLLFIEKYSLLAEEWGAKLWGINVNRDKQVYREYSPFSTLHYISGSFSCFLKGNKCYYDESFSLKEDYDMTLQQINKYRIALRINKFFYQVKQSEQIGGCATYRNFEVEKKQLELLRKKWGSRIVKIDTDYQRSHGLRKSKVHIDYNPIIRVPISGS